MNKAVLSLEGTLCRYPDEENPMGYECSIEGKLLYGILRTSGLQTIVLTRHYSEERMRAWMVRERLAKADDIHCWDRTSLLSFSDWKIAKLENLLGIGNYVSFYLDTDPDAVQGAMEIGVTSLLAAYPRDYPGRINGSNPYVSWSDLVVSLEAQDMSRAVRESDAENNT